MRRNLLGSLAALACVVVLTAVMLPLRAHLSVATTALVLVVPVVIGVASGGFTAGAVSVVTGFLVYDFFFIQPYSTLDVGAGENWVALGVYALVMMPVARLTAGMNSARAQARQRGLQLRRLFDLSTQLVQDQPLPELLSVVVTTLADVLDAGHVALLLPDGDGLRVAAAAGDDLAPDELERLQRAPAQVLSLDLITVSTTRGRHGEPIWLALVAAGRPIGILAFTDVTIAEEQREPLLLFAHQIALAVERAQLRERALQAELTQQVEHLARTLVAAVSHDLRSPLASIKASSSVLADTQLAATLTSSARGELARLIDSQTDRLAALVTNLLDMSRVQAGVLQPRTSLTSAKDLVTAALRDVPVPPPRRIITEIDEDLPPLAVDIVLIVRVLTNLLDNAFRYAPRGTPITLGVHRNDAGQTGVIVSVADHGPGIPASRRDDIFSPFLRREADAGTGLGLAIAKIFVEAHDQRIWVVPGPGGGACFSFTLPTAADVPGEAPGGRSNGPGARRNRDEQPSAARRASDSTRAGP